MDKRIKEIVKHYHIDEKRANNIKNKERMFILEREMAKLTLNYTVGTYVHLLENYNKEDYDKLKWMEKNLNIVKYLELKREYMYLLSKRGEYEKSINVDFRNAFREYKTPNIFIYDGNVGNLSTAKNVILPEINEIYRDSKDTIIYPYYPLDSNREYRHFYNKASFKYLEGLSQDFDFDLSNKKIGKVRIKK